MTLTVVSLDLLLILMTLMVRAYRSWQKSASEHAQKLLMNAFTAETLQLEAINPKTLLRVYNQIASSIHLNAEQDTFIQTYLVQSPYVRTCLRRLHSRSALCRIEAVACLGNLVQQKTIRTAMLEALHRESNQVVTLYLFQALAKIKEKRAIAIMIRKTRTATAWMAGRYRALLLSYGNVLLPYLKQRLDVDRTYLGLLITQFAIEYPSEELTDYLIKQAENPKMQIRKQALTALCQHAPEALIQPRFLESRSQTTRFFVIQAYGMLHDKRSIEPLLAYGKRRSLQNQVVQSLSDMAWHDPTLIQEYLTMFEQKHSKAEQLVLAKVLDNRLSYLLETQQGEIDERTLNLIANLASDLHISGLVQFLNTNTDAGKQEAIGKLLRTLASRRENLRSQLYTYLQSSVFKAMQLPKPKKPVQASQPHQERPQRLNLILLLILTILIFPVIILMLELPNLVDINLSSLLALYVVRFNYLLVYYSLTINAIYLVILVISFRGAAVQNRLWRAKDKTLLYTKGLLPSISIIAPAYNEASNIIESTNSLLNQQYPDFELIVVNDGSKDDTLAKLIEYFNLEKRDQLVPEHLHTRPLRGIYKNKNIPNLVVVDKVNGGKADSLNLGLNVASKEFFCGIDADSLLEPDALLRSISVMLDHQEESIATGGNICPVNGCSVQLGALDSIALPDKFLARLQSLEYIRSFMTGRVGWARMNLLLIISGAFGVFHRQRTIATGGYLTKSGRYKKDTVGEDMELVVRLSRYMRERRLPYRVQYASNANCWTEVPEKLKVLRRQRDRWHRGLIDILLFHSTMIANPRYGRLGMVGMLYYFLFELLGPFVEAQGLFFVILGAFLGLLNLPIALSLFTATILLGILVSLCALFISEFDRQLYSNRDMLRLIGMAVVENFGVRQMISLWRVRAYFSAMRKNRGWGQQVRTGFKPSPSQTKTQ